MFRRRYQWRYLIIVSDVLILVFSFLYAVYLKPGGYRPVIDRYGELFLLFSFLWISIGFLLKKYDYWRYQRRVDYFGNILFVNFIVSSLAAIGVAAAYSLSVSRYIFFGTVILATLFEFMAVVVGVAILKVSRRRYQFESDDNELNPERIPQLSRFSFEGARQVSQHELQAIREAVSEESGDEVVDYLQTYIDLASEAVVVLSTTTLLNIQNLHQGVYQCIVNLKRINDLPRINKFLEAVNARLPLHGLWIGCVETNFIRKQRIMERYPFGLNHLVYWSDFLFTRVVPKLQITKSVYYLFTGGQNRRLSRAEALGRLYSCGFEVIREDVVGGKLFFIARKLTEPDFNLRPTYGPFIKLERIGKEGKVIGVYKMRTMHPFSEYIQQYVFDQNSVASGGKLSNDFRVTTWGRFLRKFWLDELPMLLNLLAGDMKLVGVRPLSRHYFSLYTTELQQLRIKTLPGLIPPFYADMPETLDQIMESELRYLQAYQKNPLSTDVRYLFKALFNIIFRHARSN